MSVTNLNEIEKAEVLVSGLRKHLKDVQEIGITTDAINRLEEAPRSTSCVVRPPSKRMRTWS